MSFAPTWLTMAHQPLGQHQTSQNRVAPPQRKIAWLDAGCTPPRCESPRHAARANLPAMSSKEWDMKDVEHLQSGGP